MVARLTFVLFVLLLGLDAGAGIYEMRVVVPGWVSALGAGGTDAPALAIQREAGPKWWIWFTPSLALFTLLALLTGFHTAPEHRAWRMAATGLELAVVATTFAYFVPTLLGLLGVRGSAGADAAARASTWAAMNWVRAVVTLGALVAALRALMLPM